MVRVEHKRAVVGRITIAVHVSGDARRIRETGEHALEPIQAHDIEQIVADVELNLVAPIHRRTTSVDVKRIRRGADETVHAIANAVQRIGESPGVTGTNAGWRKHELDLTRFGRKAGSELRDVIELRSNSSVSRCNYAGRRRDARRLDEHRSIIFRGQSETRDGIEIEIDDSGLVLVP